MTNARGFKIGKRLFRVTRWIVRKTRGKSGYQRLGSEAGTSCKSKPITKLINWGRRLTNGAKAICLTKSGSGYIPIDKDPTKSQKPVAVPRGYLAVKVGQKDGDFHRVLVPVIYFNHPLFGKLLREAEEEYGFNQQGGITIPCRFSEFVQVQTRIAAGNGSRAPKLTWNRNY